MKTNWLDNLSRNANKLVFGLKKHSPEILVGVGVVGTVTSTVMACKATTKLDSILDEHGTNAATIHEASEKPELLPEGAEYTEEDMKKDLTITYVQTGIKVAKLYAPAVAVGILSLGCILTSHKILRTRNVALAAAYATIDKGFKEYRGRVVERFGDRIDKELKYNIQAKEFETTTTDKNGKEKTTKETVEVSGLDGYSDYARFFDELNVNWKRDPEYNLMFLKQTERMANDKLQRNGYLFLNEVYEMLSLPRTQAGQVVGWMYDKDDEGAFNNFVDFGIYNANKEVVRNFVNGYEPSILLDFNVDGNVWNLM